MIRTTNLGTLPVVSTWPLKKGDELIETTRHGVCLEAPRRNGSRMEHVSTSN